MNTQSDLKKLPIEKAGSTASTIQQAPAKVKASHDAVSDYSEDWDFDSP
jgi:hypothetical protein